MSEHECVAPGCSEHPQTEFTAAASGRLAGRDWEPGQVLRFCPRHANDIYNTQGAPSPDDVAEWLRPNAADPPNTWKPRTHYLTGQEA